MPGTEGSEALQHQLAFLNIYIRRGTVCVGVAALHRNDRCGFFGLTETLKYSVCIIAIIAFNWNCRYNLVSLLLASEAAQ